VQDGNAGFSEVSPVLAGAARAKADKVMAAAWSAKFDENLSGSARWNASGTRGPQVISICCLQIVVGFIQV